MASEGRRNLVGIVSGEASPSGFDYLAEKPSRVGEYVTVEALEGNVLGLVEASRVSSDLLGSATNFQSAQEAKKVASSNPRDKRNLASVRVLGLLDYLRKGGSNLPSLPPEPGSEVFAATPSELKDVFSRDDKGWAKVGTLLRNENVPVSVNVNRLASRHLGILAATGSGKSNLLALLAKRLSDVKGTLVIFDYQGEYSDLKLSSIVHLKARINPRLLDVEMFADVLDVRTKAERQRSVLNRVFTEGVRQAKDFWGALLESLANLIASDTSKAEEKRIAERLTEIVERARRRKGAILDPDIGDPVDQLKPNQVNVLNMLELTEMQASIVISYYLDEVLEDRKKARRYRLSGREDKSERIRFMAPVVFAIEEAHSFLPNDRDTDAKYVASKVAREGRKFGVALIVVSQRPSRLDSDVLSQMGSLAVSRITQPKDQSYIIESSELVSEELASYLPSLNVGETVLLGQWVTLPSLAKIDKVEEKLMGADIDAVAEWSERAKVESIAAGTTSDSIREE